MFLIIVGLFCGTECRMVFRYRSFVTACRFHR